MPSDRRLSGSRLTSSEKGGEGLGFAGRSCVREGGRARGGWILGRTCLRNVLMASDLLGLIRGVLYPDLVADCFDDLELRPCAGIDSRFDSNDRVLFQVGQDVYFYELAGP